MSVPADTIPSLAQEARRRWAGRPAIVDGDRSVNFAHLVDTAEDIGRALLRLGIRHGEAVAIWMPNRWEWVAAAIGAQSVGAVIVPLNTRLKGFEISEIMLRANARVLFSAGRFLGHFYPDMLRGHDLPALEHVIVTGEERSDDPRQQLWDVFLALGAATPAEALSARRAAVLPTDLADLMFTSGTTGRPKGAMFTHAQTVGAARMTATINGLTPEDRFGTFGPFSHNASYKAGWVAGLASGCAIVITTDLTAPGVIDQLSRQRVSLMPAPPTVWQGVLDEPSLKGAALESLRLISTGGTTVPVQLVDRLRAAFPGAVVTTGYGLTECCGSATATRAEDTAEIVASTAGRAIPGTEIRILDADGQRLATGGPGEILVRNASLMTGYLDDPAATRDTIDEDGWLHTGDVGALDEHGNLRIVDRIKDIYIVGGFNCYPAEVERLMSRLPGIRQVAVRGVDDARLGQVGQAYVVAQPDAALDEAGVIAWCRQTMANYKVPRSVRFVDALPMTASGKVMKLALD